MLRLNKESITLPKNTTAPNKLCFAGNDRAKINTENPNTTIKTQPKQDEICFGGPLTGSR
ncbi:MAG: hypothetical protein AB1782_14440 [Cyanobacteriota bacterium]